MAQPKRGNNGGGRPRTDLTVLARYMAARHLSTTDVAYALGCSARQMYNFSTRSRPLEMMQIAALCRLLQLGQDDLVDRDRYLRLDAQSARTTG